MIHTVLLTLQLLDDYEDWEQDLEDGSYNCLLSLVRSCTGIAAGEPLTVAAVKDFIYVAGGFTEYTATAQANHLMLEEAGLQLPLLVSFHLMLVQNLQQIAAAIEAQKQLLLGGGWITGYLRTQTSHNLYK